MQQCDAYAVSLTWAPGQAQTSLFLPAMSDVSELPRPIDVIRLGLWQSTARNCQGAGLWDPEWSCAEKASRPISSRTYIYFPLRLRAWHLQDLFRQSALAEGHQLCCQMSEQKLAREAPEPTVRAAWLGDAAEQPPQTKEQPIVDFRGHERAPKGFKTDFAVKGRGSKRKLEAYREQVVAMALSLLQDCRRQCCWPQPCST